jgi:DNA glycosylase AlkZ-like
VDGLEVARQRLCNQHLSGPPLPDAAAVVGHLGAVQAQEYPVAKWSLAQRSRGADDAAVQRAVDEGAILRTHALRPTWHFVAAADIGWLQALTGPRVHVVNAHYYRLHGLDREVAARTNKVITAALRGGNHLTRAELAGALAAGGLAATGNRLAYIVLRAELDGLIASGPVRGRQHTYALISERAPDQVRLEPEAALAELTRRYFTSHGPATVKDFGWWSSLTVAQIRRGLELVGSALARETVAGRTYWFAPRRAARPDPSPTAHVLQSYDELVVAYTESRDVINCAGRAVGPPDGNRLIHPIVLDGQVVGAWRRVVSRAGIAVHPAPVVRLRVAQRRAVEAAFARYAEFAGLPVTVHWPDG